MDARGRLAVGIRYAGAVFLAVALAVGAHVGWLQLTGNFHTVVADKVYRSAQPGVTDIRRYVDNYRIRSIINLRGENKGKPWYDDELAESKELGISHYDFGMSAGSVLNKDRAKQLIELMAKVEKPVLIHCEAGADRSGLASALYLAAIANAGEKAAEGQLSLRYGHFSVPYLSQAYPMDESFEKLEPWLGFPGS